MGTVDGLGALALAAARLGGADVTELFGSVLGARGEGCWWPVGDRDRCAC